MSKTIKLSKVVSYSKKRIDADEVSIENFVTIDNILQNKAGITTATNLPPSTNAMPAYEAGHILVGNIRPYLKKIWFANRDGGCSADVLNFEINTGYDSEFVYYSLFRDDFFTHMMKGAKGTKMPRGDKSQILDFLIPDYDISTQQKIAAILSALDAKIEINQRINAELESMAKTLYDYWFVQFEFPNQKGKPYKSSGGKMVWNEALKREIPLGWEVGELGNVVNVYDSKRIPLSNIQREKIQGKYPYYGATSVMDYINDFIFDGEYILIAEDGSVMDEKGFPFVQYIWGKTWVNNHAHVLQPKDLSNYDFLFFLLKSISVVQIMTGSVQKKINQENLVGVKFATPDKNTLKLFSEFTRPIRKRIINLTEESQTLTEVRDWLLPMLMNGQVGATG